MKEPFMGCPRTCDDSSQAYPLLQNVLKECAGVKRKKKTERHTTHSFPCSSWFDEEYKFKKNGQTGWQLLQHSLDDSKMRQNI